MSGMKVAIVGAGLAGIAAGRALAASGSVPILFEKSRGVGGRAATRRGPEGAFDHGAPVLDGLPDDWARLGVPWRDGVVGLPGMSALPRAMAAGLEIRTGARVEALTHRNDGWRLDLAEGGAAGGFSAVLVTAPLPQTVALAATAGPVPDLAPAAMAPGWTVMARFAARIDAPDRLELAPPLGLALRNGAKPGREPAETWVLHADPGFAAAEIEAAPGKMAARLVAAFSAATGAPEPVASAAHRWRFARTARPLGRPCHWDAGRGIGFAGDWCLGPNAGDAVASGAALAAEVAACPAWAG